MEINNPPRRKMVAVMTLVSFLTVPVLGAVIIYISSTNKARTLSIDSGILPAFERIPNQQTIKDSLGLSETEITQLPLSFTNIAGYANFTEKGWSFRIRGLAYRTPPTTDKTLDELAKAFIPDSNTEYLNVTELAQSRNMTSALISIIQPYQPLSFHLRDSNRKFQATINLQADQWGKIDQFVTIPPNACPGNTTQIESLDLYVQGIENGNASVFLVPTQGFSIVSDIDDILRFTQIYKPKNGFNNSFQKPFVPWSDMPSVVNKWAHDIPNLHFHYSTTTPEQFTRQYEDFIYKYYPIGSLDTGPLNFTTTPNQAFSVRKVALVKFFDTYSQRKIILLGDTSNGDIMTDYPEIAKAYPNQLACILLRNISATDSTHFSYNTSEFKDLDKGKYMFFRTPDDIRNLNFSNGECVNQTFLQNVTFDTQADFNGVMSIYQGVKVVVVVFILVGAWLGT